MPFGLLTRVFKSNYVCRTGFFAVIAMLAALSMLLMSSLIASASTVRISDPQHILTVSQVQGEGQNLSYPLDIYVTKNFSGTRSQFDQHVKQDINSPNKIVMAIDTVHKYLAIAGGTGVPLSNSQYQDAVNAFSSSFNNGDYTGATIAAIRSLESSLSAQSNANSNNTPSHNTAGGGLSTGLFGTLCCVGLVILAILGALFFVLRRRGGFGGWRRANQPYPPYQQPISPYNQYNQGYPPGYGPGYPGYNQGAGMNPWAAGGIGAAAGGLIGYELGQQHGEEEAREQQMNNDNPNNDGGDFGGGAGGSFGGNDNGGFGGGAGGDFGGGDWGGGGGNDWGGGGGGGDAGGGAGGNF
jgi:hypothetical protein